MSKDLNTKEGQKLFINDYLDELLVGINESYGPILLEELQKRLEFTIKEFHDDLKIVLDSAFKKHNNNLDASQMFSSKEDDSEIPAFIAEHQKKQKKVLLRE